MNSLISRGNAVFAFAFSAISALSILCFLTTCFTYYGADVKIKVDKVVVKKLKGGHDSPYVDVAFMKFGLDVDFSELFNWNTKMLFAYLMAEYQTEDNVLNQVVIWDKKVMREDDAHIQLVNMTTKYYFVDDGLGLRGNKNVTLLLQWNVMPNIGTMPFVSSSSQQLSFPAEYARS